LTPQQIAKADIRAGGSKDKDPMQLNNNSIPLTLGCQVVKEVNSIVVVGHTVPLPSALLSLWVQLIQFVLVWECFLVVLGRKAKTKTRIDTFHLT